MVVSELARIGVGECWLLVICIICFLSYVCLSLRPMNRRKYDFDGLKVGECLTFPHSISLYNSLRNCAAFWAEKSGGVLQVNTLAGKITVTKISKGIAENKFSPDKVEFYSADIQSLNP